MTTSGRIEELLDWLDRFEELDGQQLDTLTAKLEVIASRAEESRGRRRGEYREPTPVEQNPGDLGSILKPLLIAGGAAVALALLSRGQSQGLPPEVLAALRQQGVQLPVNPQQPGFIPPQTTPPSGT